MDSSKRRNNAENLIFLNKSFDIIKQCKIFDIILMFIRIHPLEYTQQKNYLEVLHTSRQGMDIFYKKKIDIY